MNTERVLAMIRAAADPRAQVELYGSCVYAPAHASDVDVLVSHDDPVRLAAAIGFEVLPTLPPRLHGNVDGVDVDITIVNGDDGRAESMRAGPRDAATLAEYVRAAGRADAFHAAWPHVRQFVRARALGHNGLGWFGSFGWALLLAVPLVTDAELAVAAPGATLPGWFRWLAQLQIGWRVDAAGTRGGDPAPFFLAAPSPPARDVAKLTKRAAGWLFTEARAAASATTGATSDADAIARIADIAAQPPAGSALAITGTDAHSRGRYDGTARGLIRELEAAGSARSWGRFDIDPDGDEGGWQHRITVPTNRLAASRVLAETWLALTRIDAVVE